MRRDVYVQAAEAIHAWHRVAVMETDMHKRDKAWNRVLKSFTTIYNEGYEDARRKIPKRANTDPADCF
jgi:hypothetical protein